MSSRILPAHRVEARPPGPRLAPISVEVSALAMAGTLVPALACSLACSLARSLARTLAVALAASLILMPGKAEASAREETASGILGFWVFETTVYRGGDCRMTGQLNLSADPETGHYACELIAQEQCETWGRARVHQTCTAQRFGNQVSIRSRIAEVLEATGPTGAEIDIGYVPDNFALTIQGPDRMYGALVSAVTATAEFRRAPGAGS